MIKSFKSKKLERFAKGKTQAIDSRHVNAVRNILTALQHATCEGSFDLPGRNLHSFNEKNPKIWSLDVNRNYRILFEFDGTHVYNVDYKDTH